MRERRYNSFFAERAGASELGAWLAEEMKRRGLTQNATAVHAGVAPATISEIVNKGHIPKAETLFRLAKYFDVSREFVLRLAEYLPASDDAEIENTRLGHKAAWIVEILSDLPLEVQQQLADQFIAQVETAKAAYRAGVEGREEV